MERVPNPGSVAQDNRGLPTPVKASVAPWANTGATVVLKTAGEAIAREGAYCLPAPHRERTRPPGWGIGWTSCPWISSPMASRHTCPRHGPAPCGFRDGCLPLSPEHNSKRGRRSEAAPEADASRVLRPSRPCRTSGHGPRVRDWPGACLIHQSGRDVVDGNDRGRHHGTETVYDPPGWPWPTSVARRVRFRKTQRTAASRWPDRERCSK